MKKTTRLYVTLAILGASFICFSSQVAAQNTLSAAEKKAGWYLLFNGQDINNFKGYNQDSVPQQWSVKDGALCFDPTSVKQDPSKPHHALDLVTKQDYQDYEFSVEWKISKNGNSGILFNVVENPSWDAPYYSGPEMQVLDNAGHPDARIPKHRAGDLYDLIKSSSEPAKPYGEWNHVRIVSKNAHYQFFLNDVKINEFTMHTPEWDKLVAGSKFKAWPQFGKATKGKINLQAHGDKVCYRAIKIRQL